MNYSFNFYKFNFLYDIFYKVPNHWSKRNDPVAEKAWDNRIYNLCYLHILTPLYILAFHKKRIYIIIWESQIICHISFCLICSQRSPLLWPIETVLKENVISVKFQTSFYWFKYMWSVIGLLANFILVKNKNQDVTTICFF